MLINVKTKCPYCCTENVHSLIQDDAHTSCNIVHCDSDKGGCDKDYALQTSYVIKTTVYKLIKK